ncbi:hypothetical protein KKA95_00180 [Patescibacteria group bacterium]|nr:hypothetical protein [Patescibacteria group bacterium]
MKLETIMEENWKKIREQFFYPDLPLPKLVNDEKLTTACLDMIDHQILINKDFVEELNQRGVDHNTAFRGLLAHELNHYLYCPFDLSRLLYINALANRVDQDAAEIATALYIDVVDNLDLMMRKGIDEIGAILKTSDRESALGKVITAFYQEVTGYEMELNTENELDDYMKLQLERLYTIDFFKIEREGRNVTRFTRIIRDLMDKSEEQPSQKGIGQGMLAPGVGGKPVGGEPGALPSAEIPMGLGNFGPEAYDVNEINQALKELAKKLNKKEFDQVVEGNGLIKLLGIKAGTEAGDNTLRDMLYYQKLADNYPVGIKKRKIRENGSLFPHSHKKFELDDNPQDIDVYASLGKPFLPGLGKVWVKKEGSHYAQKEDTPDVLIMRDISSSMCDCEPHAEVACLATANAYLDNDSAVAAYLFNTQIDNEELGKGYQTDRTSVHAALTKSNSGGTTIDQDSLHKLEETLKKAENEVDVVLVTDLEITGRETLFEFLHNNQDRNRVTIIYTGRNGNMKELQDKYQDDNFAIYHITTPEDIPSVVIGEVNKSIK